MKLRAPRCSEAILSTSLPACSAFQLSPPPCPSATALPAAQRESATPSAVTHTRVLVRMVGHPLRRRPARLELRYEPEKQEVREVQDCEDARQDHIQALSGLQS